MNNTDNLTILAPMEGVLDSLMREILTEINNYSLCITEFVRVIEQLVPKHTFYKICPELNSQGYTPSLTPVRVQLLGQHPQWMAENAIRAIELGSHGIDINFGCPAKAVNKSKGGAVLLQEPEKIYQIVHHVKEAIEDKQQLSVKIRLGFNDSSLLNEITDAITSAKADLLTVHARTKKQGYKPPAYWHYLKEIGERSKIPLVANGEIWNFNTAKACMKEANTSNIMLGRGALAQPNLANIIRNKEVAMPWSKLIQLLHLFASKEQSKSGSYYFPSRLKQWLRYLKIQYPEAALLFEQIKPLSDKTKILSVLTKNF